MRAAFAEKMIEILERGKVLINFDETMIGSTTSRCRSWDRRHIFTGRCFKREFPGLSLLLAISSDAKVYFKFLEGANNERTVASFLS